jgi:2'-5' RNA ligase
VRLFVAVWPDDETRRRLAGLELELGRTKGLRFVGPERWHVTLRFLGEVAEDDVGALGAAVISAAAASPGPLECRLGPGTGWFTGVRVLHLPATGLDGLAAAVRAATLPIVGEPAEAEPAFNGT